MPRLNYSVTALAFAMSGALAWQVHIFNKKSIFRVLSGGDSTGLLSFLARDLSPLVLCVFYAFLILVCTSRFA